MEKFEICKSDLKDYPNIKLLKISDKEILLKTLAKMSVGDLAYNLEKCQEITINYAFNTIDSFIYDTNRQIEKTSSNYKKSELGPRPDLMHNTNLYAL